MGLCLGVPDALVQAVVEIRVQVVALVRPIVLRQLVPDAADGDLAAVRAVGRRPDRGTVALPSASSNAETGVPSGAVPNDCLLTMLLPDSSARRGKVGLSPKANNSCYLSMLTYSYRRRGGTTTPVAVRKSSASGARAL